MGVAWLALWNNQGRGRKGAGSWIRTDIAPGEAPEYEWIWIEPYLTTQTEVDTYRGQQAGRALMVVFAETADAAATYWFERAKEVAAATEEEWLFLTGIMQTDGWIQSEATSNKGTTITIWTKAAG